MSEVDGRCDDCGQYMSENAVGASFAYQYDFAAMCCDYLHFRCWRCSEKYGNVGSNAKPHNGDMREFQWVVEPTPTETQD